MDLDRRSGRDDIDGVVQMMECEHCGRWLSSCVSVPCKQARIRQGLTNPRVSLDEHDLDDFMARDVAMVHFEATDRSQWYLTVELADGQVWQLHFGAMNSMAAGYACADQIEGPGSPNRGGDA